MSIRAERASQQQRQRGLLAAIANAEAADARLFAHRMRLRAELDESFAPETTAEPDPVSGPEQFGVLELAGTARIGQLRASGQFSDARRLVELFAGTLGLLTAGVMFRETAVLLLALTRNCTAAVQVEVEGRLLPALATANTADVRRLVTATIVEVEADLDPELTRERLADAKRQRRVWVNPMPDGINHVGAALDNAQTRRWVLDFEELVRAQAVIDRRDGRRRSADQRRADLFAQLPSQLLALITAIQQGNVEELRRLAQHDPDTAERLEALAQDVPPPDPPLAAAAAPAGGDVPVPASPAAAAGVPPGRELTVEELTIGVLRWPVRNPTVLNVHIPMTTLLELDNRSGLIEGLGPVPAEHARLLVPFAGLRKVYVDPHSGVPLGIDPHLQPALVGDRDGAAELTAGRVRDRLLSMLGPVTLTHRAEGQHAPSAALRRFVEVRDQHCLGIGCSTPAVGSDKDHEHRYPDGPTAAWNLSSKSDRCHRAKHAGWHVTRHPNGSIDWTSPLGHSYHRPGVWQAPPAIAATLSLPPARLATHDDHDPHPRDLPLWEEPSEPDETPAPPPNKGWDDTPRF